MPAVIQETKPHPYIARLHGICGGRSIIEGTRIPVWSLVKWYKLGFSIEDIIREFSQLHPAQIYDAFSYYYDHQQEIESDILENEDEETFRRLIQ
jgi:type III restriction enzyme